MELNRPFLGDLQSIPLLFIISTVAHTLWFVLCQGGLSLMTDWDATRHTKGPPVYEGAPLMEVQAQGSLRLWPVFLAAL